MHEHFLNINYHQVELNNIIDDLTFEEKTIISFGKDFGIICDKFFKFVFLPKNIAAVPEFFLVV